MDFFLEVCKVVLQPQDWHALSKRNFRMRIRNNDNERPVDGGSQQFYGEIQVCNGIGYCWGIRVQGLIMGGENLEFLGSH